MFKVDLMRLLDFGRAENGLNPPRAGTHPSPPAPPEPSTSLAPARSGLHAGSAAAAVPAAGIRIKRGGRNPVDLGHLKQRIDSLEQRLHAQSARLDDLTAAKKLDLLKQRMLQLEQRLDGELSMARQREHTLLEMLQTLPFSQRVKKRLVAGWQRDLPAARHWLQETLRIWWRDSQPCWWPDLVRAWQQALDEARNGPQQGHRQQPGHSKPPAGRTL